LSTPTSSKGTLCRETTPALEIVRTWNSSSKPQVHPPTNQFVAGWFGYNIHSNIDNIFHVLTQKNIHKYDIIHRGFPKMVCFPSKHPYYKPYYKS
jgi:hypothetical protein